MPIYVEDASSGDDRLFHEWKLNKEAMTAQFFVANGKVLELTVWRNGSEEFGWE